MAHLARSLVACLLLAYSFDVWTIDTYLFNVIAGNKTLGLVFFVARCLLLRLPPVVIATLFQHKEHVSLGDV